MNLSKYLVLSCVLLSACASSPPDVAGQGPLASVAEVESQGENEAPDTPSHFWNESRAAAEAKLPKVDLTGDLLYDYLLAEVANQRGHSSLAMNKSAELARETADPRLAQRAARIAFESGDMEKAIEALRVWRGLEPDSEVANRMLSSVLLRGGRLEEAEVEFAKILQAEKENAGFVFLQISQMIAPNPDKQAILKLMQKLAQPYPKVPEAQWSVAHVAYMAGENELALSALQQVHKLKPDWMMAVSLEAQVLQKEQPERALALLKNYLLKNPDASEMRLRYARGLLDQKQYQPARAEFLYLAQLPPGNPDLYFAAAMISLQINDMVGAEQQLKAALAGGRREVDAVYYYLGQLAELQNQGPQALEYYKNVKAGEYLFEAQLRTAYVLNKAGKLQEARQLVQQVAASNTDEEVRLVLFDAELLRLAKQPENAYAVLQQGLQKIPHNPDLLYETAMTAERLGKHQEFDALLDKLIRLRPDLPHPYNALGYSWLERNHQLPEAVKMIEKALQIDPDDVAILDSMGWAYYKVGQLDKSLGLLRRAFAKSQDPEIASHLGEVLWVMGQRDEAQKIWQDSLKAHPDAPYLQKTMKRFIP